MNSKHETLMHEQSYLIVHSLVIRGEVFEDIREANTTIISYKEQNKTRKTTLKQIKKLGNKFKTIFRESWTNGIADSADDETIMETSERAEFEEKWSKNWQPKISDDEIYQICGKPRPLWLIRIENLRVIQFTNYNLIGQISLVLY